MKKILIYLLALLILITASSCGSEKKKDAADLRKEQFQNIRCNFYEEKSFRRSVSHAKVVNPDSLEIKGGITPHHLLADDYIASLFKTVSVKKPQLVFIIAPNHKNVGTSQISTSYSDWETPFGLLHSDYVTVKRLTLEESAAINPALMETDHSISGLVPYVKFYMPDAKFIPIMLKGDTSLEICITLGNKIAQLSKGKNSLILASVDFSHYLPLEKADKMDEITLNAIKARDLKQIRKMGNDNMDSPPSIITFLTAMNGMEANNFHVLGHSNSDRVTNSDTGYTTSYFTMIFGI